MHNKNLPKTNSSKQINTTTVSTTDLVHFFQSIRWCSYTRTTAWRGSRNQLHSANPFMNFQNLNYVGSCQSGNKPCRSKDGLLREYLTTLVISIHQTMDSKF